MVARATARSVPSTMDDGTLQALRKWKVHRYRPAEIPFAEAVHSIGGVAQAIEARQSSTRKTDWMVCSVQCGRERRLCMCVDRYVTAQICRAGSSSPAVFVYAGVFAESDDYETGNLVWGKAPIPNGMDVSRV